MGLVSGLGAATADVIYGAIAGFGLTVITNYLVKQQTWLQLIGGLFLCYLGVKTLLSKLTKITVSDQKISLLEAYASTFMLTLTNPMTIISFTAILASAGLGSTADDYVKALTLVLGVFTGSALWWLLLSASVGVFRKKFNSRSLIWINRISGAVIVTFGAATLINGVR